MKITTLSISILLLSFTLFATGCSNTAKGVSKDVKQNTQAVKRTIDQ